MIAGKGFWGRGYRERLAAAGVALLTPDKTRSAANAGRKPPNVSMQDLAP